MKLPVIILAAALLVAAGGFTFFALQTVPVTQTEIIKTVSPERFNTAAPTQ